jgi:hypothetical protein
MAREEEQQEREFLAGLKTRTGRDLAEWMAAIDAQGFGDKNETIDWLREQGLPFARASWLERIHKNGGKPIYSQSLPAEPGPPAVASPPPAAAAPSTPSSAPPPRPKLPRAASQPGAAAPTDGDALEKLLAAAKGYRPLYHLLEQEMRGAIPALTITPMNGYVSFAAPAEFAALTLHASELRLGLALGDRPFEPPLAKARLRGPGAAITHMVVLNDARQIDPNLLALIKAAQARAGG